jgi:hypothetical protein
MLENLVLFAALVLIAVIAGKTNSNTLLGAQIFLWARVAYAVVYLIGIPWLRTGVWTVSIVGGPCSTSSTAPAGRSRPRGATPPTMRCAIRRWSW